RNNYVCLRRMHLAEREQRLLADPARKEQLAAIVDWSLKTREGTRMDLPFPPLPDVWEEVQAEQGNCLQKACKWYEPCHWQRARRRMHGAQVLVVNHALYFADLALRLLGATFLPAHSVVVFDEAHHLERVATESLGLRLSATKVAWHLRRLHGRRSDHSLPARQGTRQARLLHDELRARNDAFFADLEQRLGRGSDGVSLGDEVLAEPLSKPLDLLAAELSACSARATEVDVRMELQARPDGPARPAAGVRRRCAPPTTSVPYVRWLERARAGAVLCGAPLDVSRTLREELFSSGLVAVLTSATLGPGDDADFGWFRRQLGLDGALPQGVDTLRVGSRFASRGAVEVIVEEGMPDPGAVPASYRDEAASRTLAHVLDNGGRALVLCTSWEFVREIASRLREPLQERGIALLVQGEAPLARLLRQKRDDATSVLVGPDSLWEGIDVRGDALTLVVVTRLPFQSPGHPLTKARLDAIAARGGDPFLDWSLPEAILKFRQGFGRLI